MAKKKEAQNQAAEVEVTAGGRRICPDCKLQFKVKELFDQHRAAGCKPQKTDGPTWSESEIDPETVGAPVDEATQE